MWTSILNHSRFATGQIAKRAVADPGVLKFHARTLGATELSTRLLNVVLIRLRGVGDLGGWPDRPTAFLQKGTVFKIAIRSQIESQLETLRSQPGQIEKLEKLSAR